MTDGQERGRCASHACHLPHAVPRNSVCYYDGYSGAYFFFFFTSRILCFFFSFPSALDTTTALMRRFCLLLHCYCLLLLVRAHFFFPFLLFMCGFPFVLVGRSESREGIGLDRVRSVRESREEVHLWIMCTVQLSRGGGRRGRRRGRCRREKHG